MGFMVDYRIDLSVGTFIDFLFDIVGSLGHKLYHKHVVGIMHLSYFIININATIMLIILSTNAVRKHN